MSSHQNKCNSVGIDGENLIYFKKFGNTLKVLNGNLKACVNKNKI